MVQYLITYTILRGCNAVHGMVKHLLIMFGKALDELGNKSNIMDKGLKAITLGSWVAYLTIF